MRYGNGRARSTDPTLLFALIAALGAGGMVAAWVAHTRNEARLARYHGDPLCRTDLALDTAHASIATPRSVCSIDRGTTAGRWIHRHKGSHDYRLAVRTPDGLLDSLELEGARARLAWNVASPGQPVAVERYTDADPSVRRHVTAIRAAGAAVPTAWNPDWRARDTMIGVVFLGVLTAVSAAGLVVAALRRRT